MAAIGKVIVEDSEFIDRVFVYVAFKQGKSAHVSNDFRDMNYWYYSGAEEWVNPSTLPAVGWTQQRLRPRWRRYIDLPRNRTTRFKNTMNPWQSTINFEREVSPF